MASDITVPAQSTPAPRQTPLLTRLDGAQAFVVVVLGFLLASFAATNSDIWMHLASGRLISQGQWTIGEDPFSWASEIDHTYWANHSWLYDVISYQTYHLLGGGALVVVKALLIAGLLVLLMRIRLPSTSLWLSAVFVGLAALTASPRLLLQPTVVSFLFFGVTLYLLFRAGAMAASAEGDWRPKLLWGIPMLCALWVNLDNWFILGPLTLGVALTGRGIGKLLGRTSPICGMRTGAIFLVSLLACLVNPHHFLAFTLPPDLSFPLVNMAGLVGLQPAEGWLAGGVVMQKLTVVEPQISSLLDSRYWSTPVLGWNVAGLSFFLLFAMSLGTFLWFALVAGRAGAPRLNLTRLLLWGLFAILCVVHYRLLPFFAIVAAPIAVLNLGDLRAFRLRQADAKPLPVAWLDRLGTIPVLLICLFLSWPGWINSPAGDYGSPRRVAWTLSPEPGLQQAAELFETMPQAKQKRRVLNFSADFANVGSYFAPGVKSLFDYRFQLYGNWIDSYIATRRSLGDEAAALQKGERIEATWPDFFKRNGINQVVLDSLSQRGDTNGVRVLNRLIADPLNWTDQYTDGRVFLFSWTPGAGRPEAGVLTRWTRRTFQAVSPEDRAPEAPQLPPTDIDEVELYLNGLPPQAAQAREADMLLKFFQFSQAQNWRMFHIAAWVAANPFAASTDAFSTATATILPAVLTELRSTSGAAFVRTKNFGPPALPILAIRKARQSLNENPRDARSWLLLADAYRFLWNSQEDYWSTEAGLSGPTRRSELRQTQIITALKVAADLDPQNSETQLKLASSYLQMHYLDAAVRPMYFAAESAPSGSEEKDTKRRQLQSQAEGLQAEVQKRRDDFDLRVESYKGLAKYQLAMQEPYRRTQAVGKDAVDQRGMGLAYSAMKVLHDIGSASSDPNEKYQAGVLQMRLALMLGQTRELAGIYAKPDMQASYPDIYLNLAAAIGDYNGVEKSLAFMEKSIDMKAPGQNLGRNMSQWLMMTGAQQLPTALYFVDVLQATGNFVRYQSDQEGRLQQAAELHLLRGLNMLEMGDTAKAREMLQESLEMIGEEVYFPDRIIAERYLEYLRGSH